MKAKRKRMIRQFTIVLTPAKEGGFVVTVPSLPGCITEGDTMEEALENAREAVVGYLHAAKDIGWDEVVSSRSLTVQLTIAA